MSILLSRINGDAPGGKSFIRRRIFGSSRAGRFFGFEGSSGFPSGFFSYVPIEADRFFDRLIY